jgi:hypothetical protein
MTPQKLPSGRIINVMKVGPMVFTSKLPTAWVLQHETKLKKNQKTELIEEANDIWSVLKKDVEKKEMKMGIIKTTWPPSGSLLVVEERTEINFVYEKQEDGTWKLQLPALVKPDSIDEKKPK